MPDNLEKYLPWLTDEQRAELYGSITLAASYPRGDPVREGVINGAFEIAVPCTSAHRSCFSIRRHHEDHGNCSHHAERGTCFACSRNAELVPRG